MKSIIQFIFVFFICNFVVALPVQSPTECNSQTSNRMSLPFVDLGYKQFYLGIFFKATWYRAAQFCRYHGMDLATVSNQEEQDKLNDHIVLYGLGKAQIWISACDLDKEGSYFWMSNGLPLTYTNWLAGEPNNAGDSEDCVELWDRNGSGLKWNDRPCWFESYFACEIQTY